MRTVHLYFKPKTTELYDQNFVFVHAWRVIYRLVGEQYVSSGLVTESWGGFNGSRKTGRGDVGTRAWGGSVILGVPCLGRVKASYLGE